MFGVLAHKYWINFTITKMFKQLNNDRNRFILFS